MGWALAQHRGFAREFAKLARAQADAVRGALDNVRGQLDRVGSLDPRKVYSSNALTPTPDLQPLRGTGIPGSYRLRVGRYRIALAILPDERLVLLTVLTRRDESTYDKLPE